MIARNPNQPRKYFEPEAITQLAESIRQYGVLNPLTVRKTGEGFELIAGERRLRAARQAGLLEVPEAPKEDLWCRLAHPGRFPVTYHYRRA